MRIGAKSILSAAILLTIGCAALAAPVASNDALIARLASAAPGDQWEAAHRLAATATPGDLPKLVPLLSNEQTTDLARFVLEPMHSPRVDAAFRDALRDAHGSLLAGLIDSVGVRRDARAVSLIGGHLADPDAGVASEAVAALGKIGTASSARELEKYLTAAASAPRAKAWAAIVECAEMMRQDGHDRTALQVFDWVESHNPPANVREAALRGKILTAGKRKIDMVSRLLRTDTLPVLRLAQTELPGSDVSIALARALPDLSPNQQNLVIEALGQRTDSAALAELIHLAQDGGNSQRLAAIHAAPQNPAMVPILAQVINDPNLGQTAADRLAALPGKEADRAIINLLDNASPEIKQTAMQMAERRRLHSATSRLIALAASDNAALASAAITALGETAGEADLIAIAELLKNGMVDADSVEGLLVAITGTAQRPDICRALLARLHAAADATERPRLEHVLGELPGGVQQLYPLYPFCIDWHDAKKRNYVQQAAMLKELGYAGVGHIYLDGVADRIKSLDAQGLRLFQITMTVNLDPAKPAYDSRFKDVLELVKGRHVQFDLLISGRRPSDASADDRAVAILREMSDLARESGAELLLYPHQNNWMERIEDAVRVADKVNRPNVAVMFNLCHWLRVDSSRDYRTALAKAMPRLRAVSICGADNFDSAPGWGHYIQPLDSGDFDVAAFLKTLRELGYQGPIGLQCFGIGGDAAKHLGRSMTAWQKICRQLEDVPPPSVN